MNPAPQSDSTARIRLVSIERHLLGEACEAVPEPAAGVGPIAPALSALGAVEVAAVDIAGSGYREAGSLTPMRASGLGQAGLDAIGTAAVLVAILAILVCLVGMAVLLQADGFADGLIVAACLGVGGLLFLLVPQPLVLLLRVFGVEHAPSRPLHRWAVQGVGFSCCAAATVLLWMLS